MPVLPVSPSPAPCISRASPLRSSSGWPSGSRSAPDSTYPANAVRALHELGIGPACSRRESDRPSTPPRPPGPSSRRHRPRADLGRRRRLRGDPSSGRCTRRFARRPQRCLSGSVRRSRTWKTAEAPRVSFSDGSNRSYDLVVGADGVHSTIRKLAHGRPPGPLRRTSVLEVRRRRLPRPHRLDGHAGPRPHVPHRRIGRGGRLLLRRHQHKRPGRRRAPGLARVVRRLRRPRPTPARPGQPRCTSRPSRRSCRRPGQLAASCSSATPPTPAHQTWPRARRWRSRTLSYSPRCSPPTSPWTRRWPATSDRRQDRVAWVQEQTHRRDRTRNLAPIVRNVTLRLAAERIFRSNYGPLRDVP